MDSLKGVLILCIAIGHNTLLTSSVPHLFHILYAFHIWGFLFIPFCQPTPALMARTVGDRAVRYLVPHAWFLSATSVLFFLADPLDTSPVAWLERLFVALAIGSAQTVKDASGFFLYWFLPALLSLSIARAAFAATGRSVRMVALLIALAAHPWIGALPDLWKTYVPFGLLSVAYVFPLGLLAERTLRASREHEAGWLSAIVGVGFVAGLAGVVHCESVASIGTLDLYTAQEPGLLLLHDATAVLGFSALGRASRIFARSAWLRLLGRHSLVIFLTHSVVGQAVAIGLTAALRGRPSGVLGIAGGLAALGSSVAVSLWLSKRIAGAPVLRLLVTPRSWDELRAGREALRL